MVNRFVDSAHVLSLAANMQGDIRYITMFDIWTSRICHQEDHDTKPKSNTILLITYFLFSTTWKLPQSKYLLFGKPCYPNQLVAFSIHTSHKE